MASPAEPLPHGRQPVAAPTRCPRCGGRLGRLSATDHDATTASYCGCCGLVTETPPPSPGPPA